MAVLSTLLELAKRATDESALKLGGAIQASSEMEKKLALLKNYREEYAQRMQADLTAGREIQHIRNFQIFIGKIDDAIKGQQQLVMNAQRQVQIEQQNWQDQERKRMSYSTLEERAEKVQLKKEARRDQLQNDEFGIRQLFYK